MMTRGLADQAKLASVQEEMDMLSDKSEEFVARKSQRTKMTPVRSEQPVTRTSRALGQSMPQPIFMSNLHMNGSKLFGSPPAVNTFTSKDDKLRLH